MFALDKSVTFIYFFHFLKIISSLVDCNTSLVMKMWLIFVVIFLQATVYGSYDCPGNCTCKKEEVKCIDASLQNLSNMEFLRKIHVLNFSRNNITQIGEFDLRDMRVHYLKKLILSYNQIEVVHERAFFGQSKLSQVDLSWNKIKTLDPMIFSLLGTLKFVSLAHNEFSLTSSDTFLQSEYIEYLYLDGCGIKHIPLSLFAGLPNLKELVLSDNTLESLPIPPN